jgi:hypothetical protein
VVERAGRAWSQTHLKGFGGALPSRSKFSGSGRSANSRIQYAPDRATPECSAYDTLQSKGRFGTAMSSPQPLEELPSTSRSGPLSASVLSSSTRASTFRARYESVGWMPALGAAMDFPGIAGNGRSSQKKHGRDAEARDDDDHADDGEVRIGVVTHRTLRPINSRHERPPSERGEHSMAATRLLCVSNSAY